jgi:hypothetical protein
MAESSSLFRPDPFLINYVAGFAVVCFHTFKGVKIRTETQGATPIGFSGLWTIPLVIRLGVWKQEPHFSFVSFASFCKTLGFQTLPALRSSQERRRGMNKWKRLPYSEPD